MFREKELQRRKLSAKIPECIDVFL